MSCNQKWSKKLKTDLDVHNGSLGYLVLLHYWFGITLLAGAYYQANESLLFLLEHTTKQTSHYSSARAKAPTIRVITLLAGAKLLPYESWWVAGASGFGSLLFWYVQPAVNCQPSFCWGDSYKRSQLHYIQNLMNFQNFQNFHFFPFLFFLVLFHLKIIDFF